MFKLIYKILKIPKLRLSINWLIIFFLSFIVPNDAAIIIKNFVTIRFGLLREIKSKVHSIEYDSYTTVLKGIQKENSQVLNIFKVQWDTYTERGSEIYRCLWSILT